MNASKSLVAPLESNTRTIPIRDPLQSFNQSIVTVDHERGVTLDRLSSDVSTGLGTDVEGTGLEDGGLFIDP